MPLVQDISEACRPEAFKTHDFADFAQEFLRRSAAYRRDHADCANRLRTMDPKDAEDLAGKWGLCFPHGSARLP